MTALHRRQFQRHILAGLWSAAGAAALAGPLDTPRMQSSTPDEPRLLGLHMLLELSVRDAMAEFRGTLPVTLGQHLRDSWAEWTYLGLTREQAEGPFARFDAFDAFARYTAKLLWEVATDSLMLQAHLLTYSDLALLDETAARHPKAALWATALFSLRMHDRVQGRLLGLVLELQLQWWLTHANRYPHNPAARYGQLEQPDHEICLRVTRAIVWSIFDAILGQERLWRKRPPVKPASTTIRDVLAAILPALGDVPEYGLGSPEDPLKGRAPRPAPPVIPTHAEFQDPSQRPRKPRPPR